MEMKISQEPIVAALAGGERTHGSKAAATMTI
jgi:hypothetical protein